MPPPRKAKQLAPALKAKHTTVSRSRASSLRLGPLLLIGVLLIGVAWWIRSSAWLHDSMVRSKDLAELEALVRQQPDDAIAQYYLARSYYLGRRYQEAESAYETTTRLDPASARAHLGLGLTLFEMGQLRHAHDELAYAIKLEDKHAPAEYTLGKIAWLQGNLDEALPHLQRATQLDPHSAPIWYGLAVCYIQQEHRDKAVDPLIHAIACDEGNPQYHTTLGELLAYLGKTQEARQHYERALQLNPDYGPAVALMGSLYLHNLPGDASLDRAKELLLHATQITNYHPQDVYLDLGEAYTRTREYRKAVPALQEAIRRKPTDWRPYYQLARVERQLGNRKAATVAQQRFTYLSKQHTEQEALEIHLRSAPQDGAAHLKLARIDAELGFVRQADTQYRYCLHLQPGNAMIVREYEEFVQQQRAQANANNVNPIQLP